MSDELPKDKRRFPRPDVSTALLPTAHGGYRRVTVHDYVETRECMVNIVNDQGDVTVSPAYEFIYQCRESRTQRRWGTAERRSSGPTEIAN